MSYNNSTSKNILYHIKTRHGDELQTEAENMENYREKIETFRGKKNKSAENANKSAVWQIVSNMADAPKSTLKTKCHSNVKTLKLKAKWGRSIVWRFMIKETDHVKCKICGHKFKLYKSTTTNLLAHIRRKHVHEYDTQSEIMAKKIEFNTRSIVWQFMTTETNCEPSRDTNCFKCKICQQMFMLKDGNHQNLLCHIKLHHKLEYNKSKQGKEIEQSQEVDEEACSIEYNAVDDFQWHKSVVWQFMIRETDHAKCKMCGHKLKLYDSGTTSAMWSHLKSKHELEYNKIKSQINVDNKTRRNCEEDLLILDQSSDDSKSTQTSSSTSAITMQQFNGEEACSTEYSAEGTESIAWRFMIRETDHIKCKICSHKLKLETSTSDMLYHIQMNHELEYNEIESNSSFHTESNHERVFFTLSETSDDLKTAQTSPTSDTTAQEIKINEGACSVEDNFEEDFKKPIGRSIVWRFMIRRTDHVKCKICGHKFKYKAGDSTSNLLRHIKVHHQVEYNKSEHGQRKEIKQTQKMNEEACSNEFDAVAEFKNKRNGNGSIVWLFMI